MTPIRVRMRQGPVPAPHFSSPRAPSARRPGTSHGNARSRIRFLSPRTSKKSSVLPLSWHPPPAETRSFLLPAGFPGRRFPTFSLRSEPFQYNPHESSGGNARARQGSKNGSSAESRPALRLLPSGGIDRKDGQPAEVSPLHCRSRSPGKRREGYPANARPPAKSTRHCGQPVAPIQRPDTLHPEWPPM
ncbi:MAG: hypothetical protein ACD_75C02076G0001 [uncultured bacterium]|nr:MAG: hypothetical protein ACD_75C02076G0001 [uncultured bacterium]